MSEPWRPLTVDKLLERSALERRLERFWAVAGGQVGALVWAVPGEPVPDDGRDWIDGRGDPALERAAARAGTIAAAVLLTAAAAVLVLVARRLAR